jgi:transcriptional regulator NrdR family protein
VIRCPTCQHESSVLLTRGERRRRQCSLGHRFSTLEVPVADIEQHKAVLEKLRAVEKAIR